MVHTACLFVWLILLVAAKNILGRVRASSGHITKLEQSTFLRHLWSIVKTKIFIILTPTINVIRLFSLSLTKKPNKLECLSLTNDSSQV
jgi:hypothetical protein